MRSKVVGFQVIPVKPHIQEEPWAGRYLSSMAAFLDPFPAWTVALAL